MRDSSIYLSAGTQYIGYVYWCKIVPDFVKEAATGMKAEMLVRVHG